MTQTHEILCDEFGEDKVGLVHGKLSKDSKNEEIDKFRDGKTKILVSTTVIEVGVDVPDADIMIIENAEGSVLHSCISLEEELVEGQSKVIAFCCIKINLMKFPQRD